VVTGTHIQYIQLKKKAPKALADVILLFIAVNIRSRILTFLEVGGHDAAST